MSEIILKTTKLTKMYQKQKAVDNVNMTIRKGDIYGFIGQNGAGKTTLIRLITGLIHKTSGDLELFNVSSETEINEARTYIGSLIETPSFYKDMTARENLEISCLVRNIVGHECIDEVLTLVGLEDTKKKKVKNFSLGMRQRLGIANALLGNPKLLILDEPINGLDPMGIVEIRELLKKVNEEKGVTILISSHILGELSELATTYGIIHDGQLVEEITAEALREKCKEYINLEVDDVALTVTVLEKLGIVSYEVLNTDVIRIYSHLNEISNINVRLVKEGVLVHSIAVSGEKLEDYFMKMMGGASHV